MSSGVMYKTVIFCAVGDFSHQASLWSYAATGKSLRSQRGRLLCAELVSCYRGRFYNLHNVKGINNAVCEV